MTVGEENDIVYVFLDKLKSSAKPERDLERNTLVSSFLRSLTDSVKVEFQHLYDVLKEGGNISEITYEDFIYEHVLELNTDVRSEYLSLKRQVEDLLEMIDKRKQYLIKKQSTVKDKQDSEYLKLKYLIGQTDSIKKEAEGQGKQPNLIELAISSSKKSFFNSMIFSGRLIFPQMEWKIQFQDEDIRKYIDFGQLPVSCVNELMKLKTKDPDLYLEYFEKMIKREGIIEKIKHSINSNPLMHDRYHIVEEAMGYFIKNDYQMFAYIIVPQIEGFFKLYMQAMHIHKETFSIGDVVAEIHKQDNFLEFLYFKFDFPVVRNPIAHGDVLDISQKQGYEILMDLYWVVREIDSEDQGYKKWMKWIDEFRSEPVEVSAVSLSDEHMNVERSKELQKRQIERTLDYFRDGVESNDRIANLKRFLSHSYSSWIKRFGLYEAGENFCAILRSQELYDAIWSKDTLIEEKSTKTLDIDGKNFNVVNYNEKPREYSNFVELMNKYKLCSPDWYTGYKDYIERQDRHVEELLKKAGLQ